MEKMRYVRLKEAQEVRASSNGEGRGGGGL